SLLVSTARPTLNDSLDVTAVVNGLPDGTPTGIVNFSIGGVPLGSVEMTPRAGQGQAADLTFPVYLAGGVGAFALTASYSGDAAFSTGGATRNLTILPGDGASAITFTAPNTVWPSFPDAHGQAWQTTLAVREVAGTASIVTGFAIDGQAQPLSQYFPS